MPTPAERKALVFFSAVIALGASTRAYRTLRSRTPADVQSRSALELQIRAADSARRAGFRKGKHAPPVKSHPKPAGPVDMDVADAAEIESLRNIGPALARRIVADRDSFGPFGSIDGLSRVKGIGPSRVKGIGPSMVVKLGSSVTFSLVPRPTNTVIPRRSELPKARRKPHRRDTSP